MAQWEKTGKTVTSECTTITYALAGTPYTVENRKKKIPHASRSGTWEHTTIAVLKDGQQVDTRYSLRDAREIAERLAEEAGA